MDMKDVYEKIKSECELPVALLTYTYKDSEGILHPFGGIMVDFRNDQKSINDMENVKETTKAFMFFNNSDEGKTFWGANQGVLAISDAIIKHKIAPRVSPKIQELTVMHPNDMDLGRAVREYANKNK